MIEEEIVEHSDDFDGEPIEVADDPDPKYEAKTVPLLSAESELVELDLSEDLQKVVFYALDEACKKLEVGEDMMPFTLVIAGDDVFLDTHMGDDAEECFESAKSSVNMVAHLASSYVFCYDGFIETDEGDSDMIIVEVGEKGSEEGFAYGLMYRIEEESAVIEFDEGLLSLGETASLFDPIAVAAAEALHEYSLEPEVD